MTATAFGVVPVVIAACAWPLAVLTGVTPLPPAASTTSPSGVEATAVAPASLIVVAAFPVAALTGTSPAVVTT